MPRRPREPRVTAAVALALAALAACSPSGRPAATGTPSVTVSAKPAPTPSATPSPAERRHVIGVLGDYGVDAPAVRQVVRAMLRFKADAIVTTGDNAYCCGTTAQAEFARRMLAPLRAPVHASLGNHDVATEGGAAFMRVFSMTRRWYTVDVGPVQFVVLDSNRTADAAQLAFVKKVMAPPRPGSFRVAVFHHPGWSCSAHRPDPGVVKRWLPLFGTNVDLVLAGHNHTYERFQAADGTPYVTTGGGGASLYASARPACRGSGTVRALKTVHHAVRLVATASSLRLEAVGVDGVAFDSVTIDPRRP